MAILHDTLNVRYIQWRRGSICEGEQQKIPEMRLVVEGKEVARRKSFAGLRVE